jgi:hypothetical protein
MNNEYLFFGNPNIHLVIENDCIKVTTSKSNDEFSFIKSETLNKKMAAPINNWTRKEILMYEIGKIILNNVISNLANRNSKDEPS